MLSLHEEPWFTFRFAESRRIPRFHLEGIEAGRRVTVFKVDPSTGQRLGLLAKATVGEGGWVDLEQPIIVAAGEAFIAVPFKPPLFRTETTADLEAIRQVNRLAFGQDAEARLVDELRRSGYVRLSLVAERVGQVVGHIIFSDLPIVTGTGIISALALAPMAVLPEWQKQGIGSALVRRGLEMCREQGHRIVVVLGHPSFYPRFGFSAGMAAQLNSPFSGNESFMAAELIAGALDGIVGRVQYAPPFGC